MISHALTIVINELNQHLADVYGNSGHDQAQLGNLAEGFVAGQGSSGISRNMLYLSVVNITEEKTMTNLPNQVRHETTHKVSYENPPVFINLLILMTATHADYTNALSVLSRANNITCAD